MQNLRHSTAPCARATSRPLPPELVPGINDLPVGRRVAIGARRDFPLRSDG